MKIITYNKLETRIIISVFFYSILFNILSLDNALRIGYNQELF